MVGKVHLCSGATEEELEADYRAREHGAMRQEHGERR